MPLPVHSDADDFGGHVGEKENFYILNLIVGADPLAGADTDGRMDRGQQAKITSCANLGPDEQPKCLTAEVLVARLHVIVVQLLAVHDGGGFVALCVESCLVLRLNLLPDVLD
jgi:hypothetical protein